VTNSKIYTGFKDNSVPLTISIDQTGCALVIDFTCYGALETIGVITMILLLNGADGDRLQLFYFILLHVCEPGFKKTRVFLKKAQPTGFFWGFWGFIGFFGQVAKIGK